MVLRIETLVPEQTRRHALAANLVCECPECGSQCYGSPLGAQSIVKPSVVTFFQGSRVLVDARDKLGIPWQHSENEKHGMFLMAFENKAGLPVEPATFQLYVPALSALWRDSGIREAFSRRSEFQLVREPLTSTILPTRISFKTQPCHPHAHSGGWGSRTSCSSTAWLL